MPKLKVDAIEVEVPQGAVLDGRISCGRPAGGFGRAGELRFDFRELTFPGKPEAQPVETTLSGVDAIGGSNLALDREGKVKPKPQDKVVVPFLLLPLAGRPLDRDSARMLWRRTVLVFWDSL